LGAGTYANHSNVTLTAYTPLNYRLVSFTGNCDAGSTGYDGSGASYSILSTVTSTVSPTSYTIQDITASCYNTANYVYVPPDSNRLFTVTLSAENNGTVTLDGSSGGVVSKTVSAGTVVSISANPSSGYSFYSWTEGLLGQPSTISLTVDKDYSSMATFASTSVSAGTGDGNIAQVLNVRAFPVNGAGFFTYCSQNHSFPSDIGGGCGYLYNNNDVLAIPVSANNGWRFTGWTGNLASTVSGDLASFDINSLATNAYLFSEETGDLIYSTSTLPFTNIFDLTTFPGYGRYIFLFNDDGGACSSLDYSACLLSSPTVNHYSFELSDSPYYFSDPLTIIMVNTTLMVVILLTWFVRDIIKL